MAILMRGGAYADFDPFKLRPREWAVVLENDPSARDGKAIYICFAAGMVKRISTYEDMKDDLISATEDVKEQYIQALDEIKNEVERLANEAEGFKDTAQAKAEEASNSAQVATQKSESASISATNAANNADLSEEYSRYSESYAVGTSGDVRPNDETDNSKYYKEECQRLYQVIERLIASVSSGGLIAAGTVTFEELPEEPQTNYMYNISNDFVSDERFADGPGISYSKGTNVYWNVDGKWDVLTGASVLGVKGENETEYQTGYINITKESLGLDGLKQVAYSGSYNDLIDKPEIGNDIQEQIDDITEKITKMQKLVWRKKNATSLAPGKRYEMGWLSDIVYNSSEDFAQYGPDYYDAMNGGAYMGASVIQLVDYYEPASDLKGDGIYIARYEVSFSDLYASNSKVSLTEADESNNNVVKANASMNVASGITPAFNDRQTIEKAEINFLKSKPSNTSNMHIVKSDVRQTVYTVTSGFAGMDIRVDFYAYLKKISKITGVGQLKVDMYILVNVIELDYVSFGYEQSII